MSVDLTARARLRDAVIALIAEGQTPTVRSTAARANVSLGLIRHHFGTMDGLLLACDEHIATLVRQAKHDAIRSPMPDVLSSLHATGQAHILGYLAHRLADPSPAINALVDLLASDAAIYIQESVDAGLMSPCPDVDGLAKMLTLYALGSLVLHEHMKRLLDIDITTADLTAEPGVKRYIALQFHAFSSLFSHDLLAKFAAQLEETT